MPADKPTDLTTRRTPRQSRSRERMKLIMEATRELLREVGLTGVTTTAIAERASIPVSSVYQYFPNKKAIFVALYEDYLAQFWAAYDRLEQPEYLEQGWRKFFRRLFLEFSQLERRDQIEDELNKAFVIYPDLFEIDDRHADATAERLAGIMRKLGSRWQMRRLKRLARFVYAIHNGAWNYREAVQPPPRELYEWESKAVEALLEECFEET